MDTNHNPSHSFTEGSDCHINPNSDEAIEKDFTGKDGAMPPDLVVVMTIWGEARGESLECKKGIASVIHNCAVRRSACTGFPYMMTVSDVCLAKGQFQCWSDGKFTQPDPDVSSPEWDECLKAGEIFSDSYRPTTHATHYMLREDAYGFFQRVGSTAVCVSVISPFVFFVEDQWTGVDI